MTVRVPLIENNRRRSPKACFLWSNQKELGCFNCGIKMFIFVNISQYIAAHMRAYESSKDHVQPPFSGSP